MYRLVIFHRPGCSVCRALEPKLQWLGEQFPDLGVEWVNLEEEPVRAAQNLVFTVPAVLFFQNDTEILRWVRNFSISQIAEKIQRYLTTGN